MSTTIRSHRPITNGISCSTSSKPIPRSSEAPDRICEPCPTNIAHAPGRFVEQEHAGVESDGTCRRHHATLAERQLSGQPIEVVLELKFLDRVRLGEDRERCARAMRVRVQAGPPTASIIADLQVLVNAHVFEEFERLPRPDESTCDTSMHRQLRQVGVAEPNAAARRADETAQRINQRGLAGAIRADQPNDLAGMDGEATRRQAP